MLNKLGSFLDKLKPQYDDDVIDRLNYIYTNIVILAFAVTVAAKQYVGQPLQCWVPAQFKGGWEQYVENYCFVENTYWVQMNDNLPEQHGEREERELQYYQWVPFVLALQALLFYIPRMIWNMLNTSSGLNITGLVQTAMQTKKEGDRKVLKGGNEEEQMSPIAKHFRTAIDYQREGKHSGNVMTRTIAKGWGAYVTGLYLVVKLLYIVNVLMQFVILNWFLGPQYTWWGIEILRDLANGKEWETSGHFPRVTMCDVEVRELGNLHRWSVQCVLMINMFNEKIYLFLWWWFLVVAVLTILNFIYWLVISLVPYFGVDFIERYMRYKGVDIGNKGKLTRFVQHNLKHDGVTVLRLLSDNCGDLVTAEIVAQLWRIQHPTPPATSPVELHFQPPSYNGNMTPRLADDKQPLMMRDSDESVDGKAPEFRE